MQDQDVREFVGTTRDEAVALAVKHFGVPQEELELRVISDEVDIAGLAGRVMVVARVPEKPPVLGAVGAFVDGVVARLRPVGKVRVDEREQEGVTLVTLSGEGAPELTRRVSNLRAAMTHLAQRAAEQAGEAGSIVRIELEEPQEPPRDRGAPRSGRGGRGDREGRRDRDGGRGREGSPRRGREGPGGGRGRGRGRSEERSDEDGERLGELARTRAAEVLESGQEVVLPPLNSRERWFVHQALNEVAGIRSESEGDGRLKRIKIVPA